MANVAWLWDYGNYSVTNVYGMVIQTAEFDGVTRFWLREKKKNGEISNEELRILESNQKPALRFFDDWVAGKFIQNMPIKLFKEPDINYSNLPNPKELFFKITGGYLILGQKLYDAISQFNLGKTHFSEIFIYDIETGEQLSNIPYYFINTAETCDFLNIEDSKSIKGNSYNPNMKMRSIFGAEDNDIKLMAEAKNCSIDLWHEEWLRESLFFSDRLVQALLDAGFTKKELGLIRCVIQ
jgi:hypothetical protein